jgi:cystathionine beta-lyase/cystathionine gamma-synthase
MANTNDVPKHSEIYDLREADAVLKSCEYKIIVDNTVISIPNSDVENLAKYFYRRGIRLT